MVENFVSIPREIGSFFSIAVAVAAADDEVDVESSSAVPTFAVVSSTEADDEPLPKRSFSLPALAHDATA